MLKKLLALFLASFVCVTLVGNWTIVQALPPKAPPSTPTQPLPQKIGLPFNKATDGATLLPNRPVSNQPYEDGRVVVGLDDRKPVLSRAYPWSAIGRLEWQTASGEIIPWCSATLIGENLLLTNSHCMKRPMVNPRTGQAAVNSDGTYATKFTDPQTYRTIADKLIFRPSLIKGRSIDKAKVVSYQSGWTSTSQNEANDWALLKIDQRLGAENRYGYMGWRTLDFSNPDIQKASAESVLLAGYSGDFPTDKLREFGEAGDTAGVDTACSILDADQGLLVHDCDTNPGASGSAIFGQFTDGNYYIVGLHAGSNQFNQSFRLPDGVVTQAINRGVQVSQWATQALSMRR